LWVYFFGRHIFTTVMPKRMCWIPQARRECDVESPTMVTEKHKATTTREIETMSSTVQVKSKTVQDRDVISFRKEYGSEEHEVFVPTDQATQVLLSLLSVVNEDKDEGKQFVLARKGDLANGETTAISDEMVKTTVVESAVRELYDDNTAKAVATILDGDAE